LNGTETVYFAIVERRRRRSGQGGMKLWAWAVRGEARSIKVVYVIKSRRLITLQRATRHMKSWKRGKRIL
jgi:hypothetical protein